MAVVDVNRFGQSGPTPLQHDLDAYRRRFEAFGSALSAVLPVNTHWSIPYDSIEIFCAYLYISIMASDGPGFFFFCLSVILVSWIGLAGMTTTA